MVISEFWRSRFRWSGAEWGRPGPRVVEAPGGGGGRCEVSLAEGELTVNGKAPGWTCEMTVGEAAAWADFLVALSGARLEGAPLRKERASEPRWGRGQLGGALRWVQGLADAGAGYYLTLSPGGSLECGGAALGEPMNYWQSVVWARATAALAELEAGRREAG